MTLRSNDPHADAMEAERVLREPAPDTTDHETWERHTDGQADAISRLYALRMDAQDK